MLTPDMGKSASSKPTQAGAFINKQAGGHGSILPRYYTATVRLDSNPVTHGMAPRA